MTAAQQMLEVSADMSDELILHCWNCDTDFESGTLGRALGPQDASELCPNCGARFATPPIPVREFDRIVRRPEDMPSETLSRQEVKRRLPALDLIVDRDIRAAVVDLSAEAPAYFWWVPAASPTSDYHHPLCRQRRGLWAHTLMLVPTITRLFDSYEARGKLDTEDRDLAIAAALLHDQRKRGPHGALEDSSTSHHDVQMANQIKDHPDLPHEVSEAVAAHMGPWYDGPEPETPLQELVHSADMLASTSDVTPHVHGPVPKELDELGVKEVP